MLVERNRICEVSDRSITSAVAETIDRNGRTVMPGLIDAHVHVLAVDAALARLSDRPVTLLTLQAAKVLEGMLQRGLYDPSAMSAARMGARRSGRAGSRA